VTTVHQPFDPRVFYKQCASLRDAGFDVHLIAPHDADERVDGISIHALSRRAHRVQRLFLQPEVYRRVRGLSADVIQIHDPELLPLLFALKATTDARVVYDMHENYRSKGPIAGAALRVLERWAFTWIDHVLLAERSYRRIVQGHDVPHTFIGNYFVPIGEDTPDDPVTEASGGPPTRLLYTGTVSDSRGLGTMVDLAAAIRKQDRAETLTMVGVCHHDDQRTRSQRRIRRDGLRDVLDWVGGDTYVPPSDMPPYYRRADVGLALCEPHPNHTGSLLTKFYEYLHYGLPIICSDFPLWHEFVETHDCGAVVPPGTPGAVLDVLDAWQDDPVRYRQCADNARAAAPQYRWEIMGDRLVEVYRDLLDGGLRTADGGLRGETPEAPTDRRSDLGG
jgi:glycosyltransferase involved in cell wall biosynthesis